MAHTMRQVLRLPDLGSLSVSSVAPLFSVAAAGGVMIGQAGDAVWLAVLLIAVPFVISSWLFRLLNRHFPHAGASYHWSRRILGYRWARFQSVILVLAYFTSIPPIIMPAARYTLALAAPGLHPGAGWLWAVGCGWAAAAMVPLLLGSRPTARTTQIFMAVEFAALAWLLLLAYGHWRALAVAPVSGPAPSWGRVAIAAVVASTIVDGWEIDSYAAEEARRPRTDPGTGGIVGALAAVAVYALVFPALLHEVPLAQLAGSPDPLALWGERLLPAMPALVILPVLASTAGSLWLTTFILSRVLFAMGRDRILPAGLGRLGRRQVPQRAVVLSLAAAVAVVSAQVFLPTSANLFALVLSAAGFFLTVEFFLDSVSAALFLTYGHRSGVTRGVLPHQHRWLMVGAYLNSLVLLALLAAFVRFAPAPSAVGPGIDRVVGILLLLAGGFAVLGRSRPGYHIFVPQDERAAEAGLPG